MFKLIGEILLYAFSLPIIGYQTLMGIEALVDVFAQIAEYTHVK